MKSAIDTVSPMADSCMASYTTSSIAMLGGKSLSFAVSRNLKVMMIVLFHNSVYSLDRLTLLLILNLPKEIGHR